MAVIRDIQQSAMHALIQVARNPIHGILGSGFIKEMLILIKYLFSSVISVVSNS